jgi:ubiquitin carboxyl-terminal hydrolase 25
VLLQNWVNAGFAQEQPMDATTGYNVFAIGDKTCDDDLVLAAFDSAVADQPNNLEYYTRALTAIATDRGSSILLDRLHANGSQSAQVSFDEPVGLENIGNTCYLNSLLQFLFTMVELRRIVLDFNDYKMEATEENLHHKKVGQRRITRKEVQTAQNFVTSLSGLFNGMIQTPQSAIRPERELAKLTLETDNAKERLRRRSTLTTDRPSLGHIDSQPIMGPMKPTQSRTGLNDNDAAVQSPGEIGTENRNLDQEMQDIDMDDKDLPELVEVNDNSSDVTLVSRPGSATPPEEILPTMADQQAILDNKENLSPTKASQSPKFGDVEAEHPLPLAPASPSKINAQAGALEKHENEVPLQPLPQPMYAPPPGKPPPVPPRKPVEPTTGILEEYARQQDVTEVLAHCLFQFSCAMRPTGIDKKSGEQEDEVHDMFFGQNVSHTVPEKEPPTAVQFFSVITRVANEPRDVYDALDTEYDLSVREGGSQAFVSMSKLPPVFSILLDRVAWDKTKNQPTKLNHHVEVPDRIFLDRYLEADPDSNLFERRKQAWQLNDRRKILETSHANAADLPSLFDDARLALEQLQATFPDPVSDDPFTSSLDIKPSTISTLGNIAEDLRAELTGTSFTPS